MTEEERLAFAEKAQRESAQTKAIFRKLKKQKPKILDRAFAEAHEAVFCEIDCLQCAHCCKTTGPLVQEADIDRLAKKLKMKAKTFIDTYLRLDEEGDWVMQSLPCPFLGPDNHCQVYEVRPKACREYPHTDRGRMHQILKLTERNASACPAVFAISRRLDQTF